MKFKKNLKFSRLLFFSSKKITLFFLFILTVLLLILITNFFIFASRIYPGIKISGIEVGGLTKEEAFSKINSSFKTRFEKNKVFTFRSQEYGLDLSNITYREQTKEAVFQAFNLGHREIFIPPANISLKLSLTKELNSDIDNIAKEIDQPPLNSQLRFEGNSIIITPSQDGTILDKEELKQRLVSYFNYPQALETTLPMKKVSPKLSYETALEIKNKLEKIRKNPIKLVFMNQEFTLDFSEVISMIDFENSEPSLIRSEIPGFEFNIKSVSLKGMDITDTKLTLDNPKVDAYFSALARQIDRSVKEPLFSFENGKVTQFQPPTEGYKLDVKKSSKALSEVIFDENPPVLKLPVEIIKPKNKLVNDLGIKELLGRGVSYFRGSIDNRIYNIKLTASKINGVLITPGETFSFLNTVGDISAESGYKQAYVIKSGRTVLDDGGGVCQDSTTLFRAVLNAGLPIVTRTAHAYRVGYYEQGYPPGLDATVFYPGTDFQFKNDTPNHILIQAYTIGNALYIDLYGTSDGRSSQTTTPVVTNVTPAPPELRQDDPTLPKGTIKQVDWAAQGATVVFSRTVKRNGEFLINETYRSNYRPWQAVFLVGIKE